MSRVRLYRKIVPWSRTFITILKLIVSISKPFIDNRDYRSCRGRNIDILYYNEFWTMRARNSLINSLLFSTFRQRMLKNHWNRLLWDYLDHCQHCTVQAWFHCSATNTRKIHSQIIYEVMRTFDLVVEHTFWSAEKADFVSEPLWEGYSLCIGWSAKWQKVVFTLTLIRVVSTCEVLSKRGSMLPKIVGTAAVLDGAPKRLRLWKVYSNHALC